MKVKNRKEWNVNGCESEVNLIKKFGNPLRLTLMIQFCLLCIAVSVLIIVILGPRIRGPYKKRAKATVIEYKEPKEPHPLKPHHPIKCDLCRARSVHNTMYSKTDFH